MFEQDMINFIDRHVEISHGVFPSIDNERWASGVIFLKVRANTTGGGPVVQSIRQAISTIETLLPDRESRRRENQSTLCRHAVKVLRSFYAIMTMTPDFHNELVSVNDIDIALAAACILEDNEAAEKLIADGANPMASTPYFGNALEGAVKTRNATLVSAMAENCDPEAKYKSHLSRLLETARKHDDKNIIRPLFRTLRTRRRKYIYGYVLSRRMESWGNVYNCMSVEHDDEELDKLVQTKFNGATAMISTYDVLAIYNHGPFLITPERTNLEQHNILVGKPLEFNLDGWIDAGKAQVCEGTLVARLLPEENATEISLDPMAHLPYSIGYEIWESDETVLLVTPKVIKELVALKAWERHKYCNTDPMA